MDLMKEVSRNKELVAMGGNRKELFWMRMEGLQKDVGNPGRRVEKHFGDSNSGKDLIREQEDEREERKMNLRTLS